MLFEDGLGAVYGEWRTGSQHVWRCVYTRDRKADREMIAAAQSAELRRKRKGTPKLPSGPR
jgi:hypothetical protein